MRSPWRDTSRCRVQLSTVNAIAQAGHAGRPFIADACHWFVRDPAQPALRSSPTAASSERQARRRFQEHVGYGPKTLQRILRMQRVLWILSRP